MIFIVVPLMDGQKKTKAQMYKVISRRPKFLPRIGEEVYVLPNVYLKVTQVTYQGNSMSIIRVQLEGLSKEYKTKFEAIRTGAKDSWTFDGGVGYLNSYRQIF